jgi:hypothetical protein
MAHGLTVGVLWILLVFAGGAGGLVGTAQAQSLPLPTPGVRVATSPPGAAGMQGPGYTGAIPQPGLGMGSQYGQGMGPVRLPNQNCGGMGQCAWVSQSQGAWAGQSQATASCTSDARVCMSTGSGPMYPTMICSGNGPLRTCTDPNAGGLGVAVGPMSTINNMEGTLNATNPSVSGAVVTSTPGPSSVLPVR